FANRVTTSFDPSVIRHQGPTPFTAPIIAPADLPSLPAFSCDPQSPIDVAQGASLSLAPGVYGNVRVNDDATLELGSGTYTFCDLSGGKHRTLLTSDDTVVQIASGLTMNDDSYSGPGCAVYLVRSDGLSLNDASVAFANSPEFHGRVWALNGRLDLGHASQ